MALVNCSECGKEVSEKASSCPNCGNPINDTKPVGADKESLGCPKCKSQELHAEQAGFSGGKALAGAVLTGGIGLLAGTIGSKEVMVTCLKCGNRFKAGEAITMLKGSPEQDLEKLVAEFLIRGDQKTAYFSYMNRTNSTRGETIAYLERIKRNHNIQIAIDEDLGLVTYPAYMWYIVIVLVILIIIIREAYLARVNSGY